MTTSEVKTPILQRALPLVVGIGCGLRLFHYLRDPSVWHDEAALIVNVLEKNFLDLLGPLIWHEAAPPLFLWLERAVVLLLGDSTYALRSVSVVASCLALILFAAAARRLLPPAGALWAVLLFAGSDRLLWHACEAKPYSVDVLLAAGVLFGYSATRHWTLMRRLIILSAICPCLIFMSYPACFLCGAMLLVVLPAVWRSGWRERLLYGTCAVLVVGAFALLYSGPVRAQQGVEIDGCWARHFPDWQRPWTVPFWSLFSTIDVARYCYTPSGNLLAPIGLVGAIWLWRRGQRSWVGLAAFPIGLAWIGACLKGYPFGGSRLEIFAAPGLALLIGAGVGPLGAWCRQQTRLGWALMVVLLLLPVGQGVRITVFPWPRIDAARAAAFVKSNWRPGDAVAANHWEYGYYFRHEQPGHAWLDRDPPLQAGRRWDIFSTPDDDLRQKHAENLARVGFVLTRREFKYTMVTLVDASGNVQFANGGSKSVEDSSGD